MVAERIFAVLILSAVVVMVVAGWASGMTWAEILGRGPMDRVSPTDDGGLEGPFTVEEALAVLDADRC